MSLQFSYLLKWTAYTWWWMHILYLNARCVPLMSCRLRSAMLKHLLTRSVLRFNTFYWAFMSSKEKQNINIHVDLSLWEGWFLTAESNIAFILSFIKLRDNDNELHWKGGLKQALRNYPHVQLKRWILGFLNNRTAFFLHHGTKKNRRVGDKLLNDVTRYSSEVCSPTLI